MSSLATNVFYLYFKSGKMVLKAYKVRVVTEQEATDLYATVKRLSQNAGFPMPVVAIASHQQPQCFCYWKKS